MTRAVLARFALVTIAIVVAGTGVAFVPTTVERVTAPVRSAGAEVVGAVRESLPAVNAATQDPDRVASRPGSTRPAPADGRAVVSGAAGLLLAAVWSGSLGARRQGSRRPWRSLGGLERAPPALLCV